MTSWQKGKRSTVVRGRAVVSDPKGLF